VRDALERGRRRHRKALPDDTVEPVEPVEPVAEGAAPELLRLGVGMLAVGGLTGTPMLVVPPFVASGAFQLHNLFGDVVDDASQSAASSLLDSTLPVLAAFAGALFAAWFAAAAGMMAIRYYGYRLSQSGDDLLLRYGLLETRTTVIPLRRVHLVDEHASFARRWLDLTAITVRTASGEGRGRTVPVARSATVAGLPALMLRRDDLPTVTQPHPRAAQHRAFARRLAGTVPAAVVGSLGLTVWTAGPADLAIVAGAGATGAVVAWWWARSWFARLGHALHDGVLLVIDGVVVSHRRHVPLVRAQSVAVTRTPFQRRAGLCTVRVHLAGNGQASVPDVSAEQALRIVEALPGLGPIDRAHWRAALATR
jgi:putative membrane protein